METTASSETAEHVRHAVGFLQSAYTILLALALGEAFKQFVSDSDKSIQWSQTPSLLSFLFLIFPFFHGMSRYFFVTYLTAKIAPPHYVGFLMFDGIAFMCMSACFFIMSRSLTPKCWKQYFWTVLALLVIDSIWICVVLYRGVPVTPWIILNAVLAMVLLITLFSRRHASESNEPPVVCAITVFITTVTSYVWMRDFYFPN